MENRSNKPDPCDRVEKPGSFLAEERNLRETWDGLRDGSLARSSATPPAT